MLAHLEHFLATDVVLERAKGAPHVPEQTRSMDAGGVPGCTAHTGLSKEHHCNEVRGLTYHDPQGMQDCNAARSHSAGR